MQLSSATDAFVIDLIALANDASLDAKLTQIFTDERTLCIGFSFGSDTSMFHESLPEMQFYTRFARFIDLQDYWKEITKEPKRIGLAKLVEKVLDMPLCKGQ